MNDTESRELLIRLDEKVNITLMEIKNQYQSISSRLTAIEDGKASAATQKDHENRIRRLERWVLLAIGALSLIQIVGFGAFIRMI